MKIKSLILIDIYERDVNFDVHLLTYYYFKKKNKLTQAPHRIQVCPNFGQTLQKISDIFP